MRYLMSCVFAIVLTLSANESKATFVPEEEIDWDSLSFGPSNTSESEFRAILNSIQKSYETVVKSFGGNLAITGEWNNEKLNAGANQMFGSWKVQITGGLARRPELTQDGFALIVCHELGHHLAGFPFSTSGSPFGGVWAANEGQSDYFSTQVCARKLWAPELEKNASFRDQVSDFVREQCHTTWSSEADRDLCYRVTAAGQSVALTMAVLMNKPAPKFETPDPAVVNKTNSAHPAVQCRMDTLFQGAICPMSFGEDLIPGKTAPGGPHEQNAERESAVRTCTNLSSQYIGRRPACWFKARF